MDCDLYVKVFACFGLVALAVVLYYIFRSIYHIVFPYILACSVNLKKKAGADWAVVTGATDGIGKAYAFELARRGFNVYLVSRTQSKLDHTREEILEEYTEIEVRTFSFDFSAGSTAAYQPLLDALNEVQVGILINNVGMSYEYPEILHKVKGGLDTLRTITTINTLPPTILTASIIPQMLSRKKGIIVNISSSASYSQMAYWAVYSAAKKYVTWLSGILRKEYGGHGLTVQAICPMLVATKMSGVYTTSLFGPNATVFAKSAVSTIGNVSDTTGYITHQLQAEVMNWLPSSLLDMITDRLSQKMRATALRNRNNTYQSTST